MKDQKHIRLNVITAQLKCRIYGNAISFFRKLTLERTRVPYFRITEERILSSTSFIAGIKFLQFDDEEKLLESGCGGGRCNIFVA